MTKEIGTLEELNVKPGDVVEWRGETWTVSAYSEHSYSIHALRDGRWISGSADGCRIVSRASDAPKLWRDMTPEEKGALLLAMHDGKRLEIYSNGKWLMEFSKTFVDDFAYRIKPEPKVEAVILDGNDIRFSGFLKGHRITFNLIDGKPDCTSIKMEKLSG